MSSPRFQPGELVVCVDAADLPACFIPLQTGKQYCIRTVEPVIGENANYNGNIHKHAAYCVRLWGVSNQVAGIGRERAYAETRFEKIDDIAIAQEVRETERIAA